MHACAEVRYQAEFPPVCFRLLRNAVLDGKKAIEATSLRPLGAEPPGDDDLVPDIGVHLAAMGKDCLVDVVEEPRQKLMHAQLAHRFRERGRADEIEEQQHALLPRRPSIPSNNYIEEHAAADQACQFEERADHNGPGKGNPDDARQAGGEPRGLDPMAIEYNFQANGDRRNGNRRGHGLHDDLDHERPSSYPFTAAGGEIEMHRPAGQRHPHAIEAAAQVIRQRGFARIVDKVAISGARNQAEHGQHDPGCQRSPHLFST